MQSSKLPSQNPDSREDQAFERGFIFGRDAIIRQIRDASERGVSLEQTLVELSNVKFTRL